MASFRGPWRFPWSRLGAGAAAPAGPTTSLRGPWRWLLGRLGVPVGDVAETTGRALAGTWAAPTLTGTWEARSLTGTWE